MLDNTVPAHPTLPAAGVYLVSVVVNTGALSPEGWFDAGLYLDRTGFNASQTARSSVIGTGDTLNPSDVAIAFAWFCPADAQIGVFVDLHNPADPLPHSFAILSAHIQRLA